MRRLTVLGLMIVGCGGESAPGGTDAANEGAVPADWVRVQADGGYSFRAPPEMMAVESEGTDSCTDGWSTPGCSYSGDYGAFSSNLTEYIGQPQYEAVRDSVDGRAAKFVTAMAYGFLVAAMNIAEIDPATPGLGLTVAASCSDAEGQQEALGVFKTIHFGEPAPAEGAD